MFSFGKDKRLVCDKQFKAVLAHNLRVSDALLTLYMAENNRGYPRLGISVGRTCGNAVVRNRWKRLLREVFRQNQDQIPPGFDYLLMISLQWLKRAEQAAQTKKAVKMPTFEQVKASFLALVKGAVNKIEQNLN
jgi:ribonuclease P protein component